MTFMLIYFMGTCVINRKDEGNGNVFIKKKPFIKRFNLNYDNIAKKSHSSGDNQHASTILSHLQYDSPVLVKLLRSHYIEPPSSDLYQLDHPEKLDHSAGQTPFIDNRLNFMVS